MARAHLTLLGGFDFAVDAAIAPALSRKARGMVAYLAMQPGHFQSRERLAALLWGGHGETQARMSLRQTLSGVRRGLNAVGVQVLADGNTIALNLDGIELDVTRFETLAAGSTPEQLEQAATVYRGDLLDGFNLREEPFEDWVQVERERLRMISIGVLERLAEYYAARHSLASYVRAATRLLTAEPLREDIHRDLMRAYARQGRLNLALKQYEHCRDVLQRQFQMQPDQETRELYQDLRARRTRVAMSAPKAPPPAAAQDAFRVHETLEGNNLVSASQRPQTHYVKSSGVNIAYQVTGDGPIDVVYVQGWVSNLDYAWESPRLTHVLRRLGSFCRLIRIDKRGTGLSDRNVGLPTLEERMEDVRAVLDAVGSRRTVLFGSSEGGIMCMLFAATYPNRTAALILHGAYARGLWSEDYPFGRTREELEEDLILIEREWGKAADLSRAAPSLMNDANEREWFAAYLRNSASPADAISLWRWSLEIDVRDILYAIHVPTLIVQRTGDRWAKTEEARYLARHIPAATFVELPGDDHIIWGADSDRLIDVIQNFLSGAVPPVTSKSVLLTVMHMDICGTSAIMTEETDMCPRDPILGWRNEVGRALRRANGREISRIGRGFIAVFEGPTRAIHCARELHDRMMDIGLVVRAAVHIGECESCGDDLQGTAIQLTSKLLEQAKPGDIVASRTVRDLLLGSNLTFTDCGEIDVAGAPGPWQYFSVKAPTS